MKAGKIITIEGTDCSGKETQSKRLLESLKKAGYDVSTYSFPMYETPTGKIVGGPYLGKAEICAGYFEEKAYNVDAKVASLYYAADRKYNIGIINKDLRNGKIVILDRYVGSSMAHQGGKITNKEERYKMYEFLEHLEYGLLELPRADIDIFLHMPYEQSLILKEKRKEIVSLDQHETNEKHLKDAERTYLEIAELQNTQIISCAPNGKLRTIDDINEELYAYVLSKL